MRLFTTIIFSLCCLIAQAQTYTVIHTIGKIQDTGTGKYLSKGMKVNETASLMFETKGAKAAMLSSSRGRYVIQENASTSGKSDIVYTLASVISPARGKLSTRAGGINNKLDFEKYFEEGPVALLGDSYTVKVSSTAYPMSESKFFYAQYNYNGETINKKLSSDEDFLIIQPSEFFSIDGNAIVPEDVADIKLFYYNSESQESLAITALNLALCSNENLKSISTEMENDMEGMLEVINSLYGKCSEEYLAKALEGLD